MDEEEIQKMFFNAHFTVPKHCFKYKAAFPGLQEILAK
jgi:hypothetical protein